MELAREAAPLLVLQAQQASGQLPILVLACAQRILDTFALNPGTDVPPKPFKVYTAGCIPWPIRARYRASMRETA